MCVHVRARVHVRALECVRGDYKGWGGVGLGSARRGLLLGGRVRPGARTPPPLHPLPCRRASARREDSERPRKQG
jgi:hypothetical protein